MMSAETSHALAPAITRRVSVGSRLAAWLLPALLLSLLAPRALRWPAVLGYEFFVVLMFAWDALRLRRAQVAVSRTLEPRLRMLAESSVGYVVRNLSSLRLNLIVRDSLPASMTSAPPRHRLQLTRGAETSCEARLLPTARGRVEFGDLFVRIESPLSLAAVIVQLPSAEQVRVVPATALSAGGPLKGSRRELGNIAQRLRRASAGTDLESLRDYVPSDPLRSIDWKATAKRNHPITRNYQPERSQTLWLVLDASRTMAAAIAGGKGEVAGKTRFDVALEAALMLADGALRAGDQVGALVYGHGVVALVMPGRGRGHYRRLLDVLSETRASPVQLDVRGLLSELDRCARKRSLLVLFTDLENESHGAALCEHARMLTRRHLTVCVSLDDPLMRELARSVPGTEDEAFQKAAAVDLLSERTELCAQLEKRGVKVVEADQRGLSQKTLDRYLEIKTHARL